MNLINPYIFAGLNKQFKDKIIENVSDKIKFEIKKFCKKHGLKVSDLHDNRNREIVDYKRVLIYNLLNNYKCVDIAKTLNMHHSSIIHLNKSCIALLKDANIKRIMNHV